jgi:hypothetical protein
LELLAGLEDTVAGNVVSNTVDAPAENVTSVVAPELPGFAGISGKGMS